MNYCNQTKRFGNQMVSFLDLTGQKKHIFDKKNIVCYLEMNTFALQFAHSKLHRLTISAFKWLGTTSTLSVM